MKAKDNRDKLLKDALDAEENIIKSPKNKDISKVLRGKKNKSIKEFSLK